MWCVLGLSLENVHDACICVYICGNHKFIATTHWQFTTTTTIMMKKCKLSINSLLTFAFARISFKTHGMGEKGRDVYQTFDKPHMKFQMCVCCRNNFLQSIRFKFPQ